MHVAGFIDAGRHRLSLQCMSPVCFQLSGVILKNATVQIPYLVQYDFTMDAEVAQP